MTKVVGRFNDSTIMIYDLMVLVSIDDDIVSMNCINLVTGHSFGAFCEMTRLKDVIRCRLCTNDALVSLQAQSGSCNEWLYMMLYLFAVGHVALLLLLAGFRC